MFSARKNTKAELIRHIELQNSRIAQLNTDIINLRVAETVNAQLNRDIINLRVAETVNVARAQLAIHDKYYELSRLAAGERLAHIPR